MKEQVKVTYQKQVVHVTINEALITILKKGTKKKDGVRYLPSYRISERIHEKHLEHYGEKLNITMHSLALEILIHVVAYMFCDFFSVKLQKLGLKKSNKLVHFLDYVKDHAETIDCGEKKQDTNRFVFDFISYVRVLAYPAFRIGLFILPVPKKTA